MMCTFGHFKKIFRILEQDNKNLLITWFYQIDYLIVVFILFACRMAVHASTVCSKLVSSFYQGEHRMIYFLLELLGSFSFFGLIGMAAYACCNVKGYKGMGPHIIGVTGFVSLLCYIFSITGIPELGNFRLGGASLNLIPFVDLQNGRFQYIANIVLFLPVGFFAPLLWKKEQSFYRMAASGFTLSLTIELLQLFTYRAVDIDDLAMNTLGAIGGYGIFCLLKIIFPGLIGSFQMPEQDCFWAKHGYAIIVGGTILFTMSVRPLLEGIAFR